MGAYREAERPQRDHHPIMTAAECGASSAARAWRPLIETGMYVCDAAGDEIGQVKEVRSGDFLIDRDLGMGIGPSGMVYVPYEHVHAMMGDRIVLDVPGARVDSIATLLSSFSTLDERSTGSSG
ncbi:MAG: PRC-barrel domain-containing protein [Chloroflexi bacterium]|nr:PRC-barrel domain-containing protein [Chloroflexota bacterium]